MGNYCKNGGKLVISNRDQFQLMNTISSTFWLSNHLLCDYDSEMFKNYIRHVSDPIPQNIL